MSFGQGISRHDQNQRSAAFTMTGCEFDCRPHARRNADNDRLTYAEVIE
jgi:hypothetical protein